MFTMLVIGTDKETNTEAFTTRIIGKTKAQCKQSAETAIKKYTRLYDAPVEVYRGFMKKI